MKFTWEPEDIFPGVKYYHSREDMEYFMIVSVADEGQIYYTSVSSDTGLLVNCYTWTKEEYAQILTEKGCIPFEMA